MGILLKKTENGISSMFFGALLAVTFLPACAKTGDTKKSGSNSSPEFVCKALSSSQEALLRMARGTEKDEQTTLVVAVDPERVRAAAKSESPNFRNENCESPLTVATRTGNQEIVKALLESGADVNLPGVQGGTALHFAAERTDVEMMKILIHAKADPKRRDVRVQTPLHRVGLQCGANCAWDASIALLQDASAETNALDEHGRTPLHLFAFRKLPEPMRFLINHQADPKAEDQEKRTALHFAVSELKEEDGASVKAIIAILAGSPTVNPYAKDAASRTALDQLISVYTDSRNHQNQALQAMAENLIRAYAEAFLQVREACRVNETVHVYVDRYMLARFGSSTIPPNPRLAQDYAVPIWESGCGHLIPAT